MAKREPGGAGTSGDGARRRGGWRLSALGGALALAAATPAHAQQPPGATPSSVLVVTENPALRLLEAEGGRALTEVNFWRVTWSPVGTGTVCFVTVRGTEDRDLKLAITDNEKLADYIVRQLMGPLGGFLDGFTVVQGSATQSTAGNDRTETCKSEQHTIAVTWKDLGPPSWIPAFRPPGGTDVVQSFVMIIARGAEVTVDGTPAPGRYFPTGGGFGPGAFLALSETWRREPRAPEGAAAPGAPGGN